MEKDFNHSCLKNWLLGFFLFWTVNMEVIISVVISQKVVFATFALFENATIAILSCGIENN